MGALNDLIPFSLLVWGQQYIESSLASILNATTPIFSVILAHFLTRLERLTIPRAAGILVGWIGVGFVALWCVIDLFLIPAMIRDDREDIRRRIVGRF